MARGDQIQTLSESFKVLAEEVQALIDRKTILEHKLRYAHEKVSLQREPSLLDPRISYMMSSMN
jgi:hypothetical protein